MNDIKHNCGIDSHAEPDCLLLYDPLCPHTHKAGKMKIQAGWTTSSHSILVFYSFYALYILVKDVTRMLKILRLLIDGVPLGMDLVCAEYILTTFDCSL